MTPTSWPDVGIQGIPIPISCERYLVAALALLVQRLLGRRLDEAGIDFSAERAMEALSTVRLVTLRLEDQAERRGVSGAARTRVGS